MFVSRHLDGLVFFTRTYYVSMSALTAATTTAFLFIFGNTIRHHSSPRNRVKFTASDWYYHTNGVRKSSEASRCTLREPPPVQNTMGPMTL